MLDAASTRDAARVLSECGLVPLRILSRNGHPISHPLVFNFWGYVKDGFYVHPLPQCFLELRARIRDAVMSVDENKLRRVWDEISFRWGVSHIARGSHTEYL